MKNKILAVGHKTIRRINRGNVLNTIREKEPISRVEISRLTGLNKSTITSIVNNLIAEDLVYEEALGESPFGRKPILLRLNKQSRVMGIIDTSNFITTLAVCDLGGKILSCQETATIRNDAEFFFSYCGKIVAEMLEPYRGRVIGVGVSLPGIVNAQKGLLYDARTIGWKDVDIRGLIEKEARYKIFVENNGKASALAQLWFSKEAADLTNFIFVLVVDGIGTGIVMNRVLYHGLCSLDGQFGNQLIRIDGKWEDVSGESTWENIASNKGIVKRYSESSGTAWGRNIDEEAQQVMNLAMDGDKVACRALEETARYLGVGIANINNGLGPERIIIGGKITQVWDLVFPELIRQVELHTTYPVVPVRELIIPSSLDNITFQGARALATADFFGKNWLE